MNKPFDCTRWSLKLSLFAALIAVLAVLGHHLRSLIFNRLCWGLRAAY